jgi:hypothetical protein
MSSAWDFKQGDQTGFLSSSSSLFCASQPHICEDYTQ